MRYLSSDVTVKKCWGKITIVHRLYPEALSSNNLIKYIAASVRIMKTLNIIQVELNYK